MSDGFDERKEIEFQDLEIGIIQNPKCWDDRLHNWMIRGEFTEDDKQKAGSWGSCSCDEAARRNGIQSYFDFNLPIFWFKALAGDSSDEIILLGSNFEYAVHNNNGLEAMRIHKEIQKIVREHRK